MHWYKNMEIKIQRLDPTIALPEYKTKGSVAFDIPASATTTIPARSIARIPTGLIIATPERYMLMIAARSSTASRYGLMLANGVGIIDQDYCGPADEIQISVYNTTDHDVIIEKGVAVAQGIFVRVDRAQWQEVSEIKTSNRGGFGSTG